MRKLTATFIAVLLSLGFAAPAESDSTKWTAYQKTLATYSGSNTALSSLQKSQIRTTLEKAPTAEKFICTGIRYYDQPMSVNIMVRKRAKEACAYAKQLNPTLSTWYQNKPTKARSYAGKVLLTVKSPVASKVALNAHDQVSSLMDGSYEASQDVVVAGDKLPEFHKSLVTSMMTTAYSMFDEDYGVIDPYKVIAFTYEDLAWADQQLSTYPTGVPSSSWQSWAEESGYNNESCTLGSAAQNSFYICMPSSEDDAYEIREIIPHEYFHSIQREIAPNMNSLPTWLIEGSATYIGNVAAGNQPSYTQDKAKTWQTYYLTVTYGGSGFGEYVYNMTEEEFTDMYRALENATGASNSGVSQKYAIYQLGSLATEYLIGNFSFDALMGLKKRSGPGQDWKQEFQNTFGMTSDAFYSKMYEHLREVYGD